LFRLLPAKYSQSNEWLSSPRGRLFVQYECDLLRQLLPRLTGYRCIQVGSWGFDRCELERAGTLCQWRVGVGDDLTADIIFDGRHLPLASGSVDAIVLAHGLEQVADPHALLRECARVLSDRGQIVVLAFNPLSLWALRQGLRTRRSPRFRPCSAPPSAGRLCDWFHLLDLAPEQIWRYGLGFPFFGNAWQAGKSARGFASVAWCAQAYAMVARRQVAPRTPIARRLGKRRPAAATGLARRGQRGVTCRR